tara:strand:- start:48 stop:305 length:258 start_codon:yes stop_codon:yes gene_type:complete
MPTSKNATCEWFDFKKGYGFIKPDGSDESLFVHQSALQMDGYRKLSNGQQCTFETTNDDLGRTKACNVVPGARIARRRGKGRNQD